MPLLQSLVCSRLLSLILDFWCFFLAWVGEGGEEGGGGGAGYYVGVGNGMDGMWIVWKSLVS